MCKAGLGCQFKPYPYYYLLLVWQLPCGVAWGVVPLQVIV